MQERRPIKASGVPKRLNRDVHGIVTTTKTIRVPEGCLDAWQVSNWCYDRIKIAGLFLDKEKAMQRARQLAKDLPKQAGDVYVAHKAVMLINGRYHFVNINSTKLADVTDLEQGNQNEIHGTSDAEY